MAKYLRGRLALKHVSRGAFTVLAVGLVVGTGTALAVGFSGGGHRPHARAASHASKHFGDAFAAFVRGETRAHTSAVDGPPNLPAEAVLLDTVGETSVYMWELKKGEPVGLGSKLINQEEALCIGEVVAGRLSAGCGPAARLAENGDVDFGQHFVASTGKQSPITVTAVVPNGVSSVKLTEADGSSREVKVTNNVVVTEANNLSGSPTTGVSYKLSSGRTHAVPLPSEMAK